MSLTRLQPGDSTLFLQSALAEPQLFELAGGTVAVSSLSGYGGDRENEDAAVIICTGEDSAVFAVADGMGGTPKGGAAAAIAVRRLCEAVVASMDEALDVRLGILNAFELANQQIMAEHAGSGTTLAVAEVCGSSLRTYHVGDSFVMVTGQRGRMKVMTLAHSPVAYGIEAGLIDADEAMSHEDRHLVSNSMGQADMRIDVGASFDLSARDTLLLASDGLSDNLHVEEIVATVRKGPLDRAASSLAERALARMRSADAEQPCKPDDLTFALFRR